MTGEGTGRQAALLTAEQLPIERSVRDWKTLSVAIGQIALRATLSSDVFPLVAEMRTQLAVEDALRKRIEAALAQASTAESTKPLWAEAQAQRQRYAVLRDALVQNALEAKIISQKELQEHAATLAQYLNAIDQLLAASEQASPKSGRQHDQRCLARAMVQRNCGAGGGPVGAVWLAAAVLHRVAAAPGVRGGSGGGAGRPHGAHAHPAHRRDRPAAHRAGQDGRVAALRGDRGA